MLNDLDPRAGEPEHNNHVGREPTWNDNLRSDSNNFRRELAHLSGATAKLRLIRNQAAIWNSAGYPRGAITEILVEAGVSLDYEAVENAIIEGLSIGPEEPRSSKERTGHAHLPKARSWRDELLSATALQSMEFPQLRYLIEPLIPQGLTLFAGRPKLGKGAFWLQQAVRVAEDGGDVLYLALEDGKRRINDRLKKQLPGRKAPERLKFAHKWRRANEGGLADIKEWCKEVANPTLAVIDTLEGFRPASKGKQRDYSADYDATKDCLEIVNSFPVSIVFIHHDRKAEADDPFDTISGTLGLTAPLDTMCVMKKQSGNVTLYVRGRDVRESETAMQFNEDTCRWTMLGNAADVNRSNARRRILTALADAPEEGMSIAEIAAEVEQKHPAVRKTLERMRKAGEVSRIARGRYAPPGH